MDSRNYLKDSTNAIISYLQPVSDYINNPTNQINPLATIMESIDPIGTAFTATTSIANKLTEPTSTSADTQIPVPVKPVTPQATNASPNPAAAPKKKRLQTTFTANITASLALAKKNMDADSDVSLLTSIFTAAVISFRNLIGKPDIINKTATPQTDINKQMEALEEQAKKLEDPDDVKLQQVELVSAQIREHAARRVDIFFYLLLAVRGKFVTVDKGATVKQHGIGSNEKGTQACHSSLFPNIKFISSQTPDAKPNWSSLFSTSQATTSPCPTIIGTFLEEVLNMTVELPKVVNDFDGHLEGRFQQSIYTKECIDIINRVSNNSIDPIQGMNEFLNTMNAFFIHMEYDYIKKMNKTDLPKAFKKVYEYEKAGTFIAANKNSLTISDQYIYLMLRLSRVETMKSMMYSGALEAGYQKIQNEIFSAKNMITDHSRMLI